MVKVCVFANAIGIIDVDRFGKFCPLHLHTLLKYFLEVKGHVHSETTYDQISTLGGIFSSVFGMRGHILMKLITITHYEVHMTQRTFSRSCN